MSSHFSFKKLWMMMMTKNPLMWRQQQTCHLRSSHRKTLWLALHSPAQRKSHISKKLPKIHEELIESTRIGCIRSRVSLLPHILICIAVLLNPTPLKILFLGIFDFIITVIYNIWYTESRAIYIKEKVAPNSEFQTLIHPKMLLNHPISKDISICSE